MRGFSEFQWLVAGTGALALLSASTIFADLPAPWAPWPTHQIVLSLLAEGRFLGLLLPVLIVPILYLATGATLWNAKNSGVLVLCASSVFLIVSAIYLVGSWPYGVRWQGLSHTIIVTAVNIVGLSVVAALAWLGFRQGSKPVQREAYFVMFAMLSWCAFPWLGELP